MKAIEFKDFSAFYKTKKDYFTALDNINLKIEEGEFVVVVGESGSGKSTLLKCCLGIADSYEGELLIENEPIENMDLQSGKFAFVRQEIALYPNLTVYENIAFPLRLMKTPHDEVDRRVKEVANILGITFLLTRKPKQISGGQQQRVALARAIVKNPSFIYFDEPFSNVDPKLRTDLRILVKKIHEAYRPTIVFVTHELPEAFFLAERIVVLEDGKIVEDKTPDQIRDNPKSELMKIFLTQREREI